MRYFRESRCKYLSCKRKMEEKKEGLLEEHLKKTYEVMKKVKKLFLFTMQGA